MQALKSIPVAKGLRHRIKLRRPKCFQNRSKTHKRLKERFLIRRNRTNRTPACFVLFRLNEKCSFNLVCVLDLFFKMLAVNSVSAFKIFNTFLYCLYYHQIIALLQLRCEELSVLVEMSLMVC